MADADSLPPPPPLGAGPTPGEPGDPGLADWEREVERVLEGMTGALGEAIAAHDAGTIDLAEFQRRCLDAGASRVGDTLVLWDWVDGKVFAYDGFQMVELTELEQ
jgi:hypothetical protein